MPILLNDLEALYYYDQLHYILTKNEINENTRLRSFNALYMGFINLLTEQREKQIFAGWFAKVNFLVQAYQFTKEEGEILQSMRRLCRKAIAQKYYNPPLYLVEACAKVMAEVVYKFSQKQIPNHLEALWKEKQLPTLLYKEIPTASVEGIFATIIEKSDIEELPKGEKQIHLQCESEDFGLIKITLTDVCFYNQKGENFRTNYLASNCKNWVKPHQIVYFTDLKKIADKHFASTRTTVFVMQPDYLLDVTKIALAGRDGMPVFPYFYLIDKLTSFLGNEHTFKGSLINEILDKYLVDIDNPKDYEVYFEEALKEKYPEALSSNISPLQIETMKSTLSLHFNNLKNAMQSYQKDFQLLTEPTFVSPQFGLQGRLDILLIHTQNNQRKDIIELKSGKAKQFPASYDYLLQVAGYNLLLATTFQNRSGVSAILYSSDEKRPLRDCGSLEFEKQDLILARNQIVYLDWEIAKGKPQLYDTLIERFYTSKRKFTYYMYNDIDSFKGKWEKSTNLDKNYFAELMGLVQRELITAKIGGASNTENSQGFAGLWRSGLSEKIENFSILYDLEIKKYEPQKNEITFNRPFVEKQASVFRKGDIILLYPYQEKEVLTPTKFQLLKGNIQNISAEEVVIKIWHKAIDENFIKDYNFWAIESTLLEQGFASQMGALSDFLGILPQKKEIWYGLKKPDFEPSNIDFENTLKNLYKNLSQEQLHILSQTLRTKDYFLLQGPPGTGKTSQMLRTMVDYLYNQTKETIVLLAFTNRATDEICQKINTACQGNYIRLGSFEEGTEFYDKSLFAEQNYTQLTKKIENTRIFVSTVSSFFKYVHLVKNKDFLIIDEASQLLEPMLCGIAPQFQRFVMIGDEKQLPAVVTQTPIHCQTDNQFLKEIGLEDLSTSVFERLIKNAKKNNWENCYAMLSTQFRTHEDIAQFISKEFYKTLRVGSEKQKEKWTFFDKNSSNLLEKKLATSRILFFETEKENAAKLNRKEAEKVVEIVQIIKKNAEKKGIFTTETVGVITPYRTQIAEIYSLLDKQTREMVTVDTVERYQGSEREFIILSMAVNYPAQMKNLQGNNVEVDKKLNVALSRAKEQLIILGNEKILREGFWYAKLLDFIKKYE
jgi:DNA replication ATP-dependent helicase Dna2